MSKKPPKVSPYFNKSKRPHSSPIKIQYEEGSEGRSPAGWRQMYDNIVTMRQDATAPVDTMGCERAHDMGAPPHVQRFQCLVSLMLSSQTKVILLLLLKIIFMHVLFLG